LLAPSLSGWSYVIGFGAVCIAGQLFLKHTRYVALLKWLTLSLFAYFASVGVVHVPWRELGSGLLLPHLSTNRNFWLMVVAIFGTTISPYLFFWQAAQEVEDTRADPIREPLLRRPRQAPSAMARIRLDTLVGMAVSNLVGLAIIITAAATLHEHGVRAIQSAAQAAEALRPLAGRAAFALFSLGIIGTGLLSVPVLAGSAAYAVGEARRWPVGLSRQPLQAKAFYGAIAFAIVLGVIANLASLNPVQALVWVAVLNGIVAVPVMALMMLMASNKKIMGAFRIGRLAWLTGWATTLVMGAAALVFLLASV